MSANPYTTASTLDLIALASAQLAVAAHTCERADVERALETVETLAHWLREEQERPS